VSAAERRHNSAAGEADGGGSFERGCEDGGARDVLIRLEPFSSQPALGIDPPKPRAFPVEVPQTA
jgi:hypothetical protein